jgi:hypothetical protein
VLNQTLEVAFAPFGRKDGGCPFKLLEQGSTGRCSPRASCRIPGVFNPHEMGRRLCEGSFLSVLTVHISGDTGESDDSLQYECKVT